MNGYEEEEKYEQRIEWEPAEDAQVHPPQRVARKPQYYAVVEKVLSRVVGVGPVVRGQQEVVVKADEDHVRLLN